MAADLSAAATQEKTLPEASSWSEQDTSVDRVADELLRLHHDHASEGHGHSAARTLNLTVVPCGGDIEKTVEWAVERLGGHNASRTIMLREHDADRLDAKAAIKCEVPQNHSGTVGLCHDVVTLSANRERLAHSASLVAPLIITGLPSVLWSPDAARPLPDPELLERVEQVVLDTSGSGFEGLRNAAGLVKKSAVRDLAWGRLDYWRAATSAAFDTDERLATLDKLDSFEVRHLDGGLESAHLYAGWIAARAGWKVSPLTGSKGERTGVAKHGRRKVTLMMRREASAAGCGGLVSATFGAGSERVEVTKGAAADDAGDPFPVALRPIASFSRGYEPAVHAALELAG